MTMTSQQVVSFARNLSQLRPDWDLAGIHDAVTTLATRPDSPFELQRHALARAAIASNRKPDCLLWAEQFSDPTPTVAGTSMRPVDHGQPCPDHDGTIRRPDGSYHCCWLANRIPPEPYQHRPHPAPPGLRAQVAAALNAPAYDRLPARTSDRQNATPDRATREGDPR